MTIESFLDILEGMYPLDFGGKSLFVKKVKYKKNSEALRTKSHQIILASKSNKKKLGSKNSPKSTPENVQKIHQKNTANFFQKISTNNDCLKLQYFSIPPFQYI